MVSVTGLDVEPEPLLPLLPQAVASRAAAATPATRVHRLTAVSLHCLEPWSGPPDHWLDEPAVCRCLRPEEVQVAALGRLQYVIAVQRRPAAQVRRFRRGPRCRAAGQFFRGHLQV